MIMRGLRLHVAETTKEKIAQAVAVGALLVGTAALAAPVTHKAVLTRGARAAVEAEAALAGLSLTPEAVELVWQGADIDGDGAPDFANPTGQDTRGHDAYGYGEFGASRDGGSRRHQGVDFMAEAGQTVVAPISGYVTKIGHAYAGDENLKYVEIANPALRYEARVFYVNPSVDVGQAVHVGEPVGVMHSLQAKYPGGMTDHVHLEIVDSRGRHIDATQVITAQYAPPGASRG
jgi:murein DD-endopeptidase MepM/ murein hydrolase activator NlpD